MRATLASWLIYWLGWCCFVLEEYSKRREREVTWSQNETRAHTHLDMGGANACPACVHLLLAPVLGVFWTGSREAASTQ